ncbi:MAG: hypothetical protein LUC22_02220, partial [Prevotella sp.]|nr:hypothetical protein [Prevotella sp.]
EQILAYLQVNTAELAKNLGVKPQLLYDILSGKTKKITPPVRAKIQKSLPEISPVWLARGEGAMLMPNFDTSINRNSINIKGDRNENNTVGTTDRTLIEVITGQQRLTSKAQDSLLQSQQQLSTAQAQLTSAQTQIGKQQEQIDRLLSLLERQAPGVKDT